MNEELKIIINAEVGKLKSELQKGQKEVENFSKKGKVSFKEFNDGIQKAGDVAKKSMALGAAAIAGMGAALLSTIGATEEYRAAHAKLSAAFEAAGSDADTAKYAYSELQRVIGDTDVSVEAANHLAKLTEGIEDAGLKTEALSEWTWACQGIYATFGDSLPIEGLTEAANETAKVGAVTGSLADALNWAGISEDAFNEKLAACNSEAEREKLIRDTLVDTYDKAAHAYEENAASIIAENEAQEKLNENMAKIAEIMLPIKTQFSEFAAVLLEQVAPILQDIAENHGQKIAETLEKIAEAIGNVLSWVVDNWELVSTLAIIITGIAVALGVFSTAMGIVNAVMYASPVTWIVMAIVAALAALIAIIVLVIKNWDDIKAATKKCWDAIVNAVKTAIDWVIGFFKKIIDFVKENWQALLLMLVNPFAGAFKLLYDNCEGFRNTINSWIEKIKTGFKNGFEAAKNFIVTPIQKARDTALGIFDKIKSGFSEKINAAKDAVKTAIDKIKSFFSFKWELPKIKTPKITITWETKGVLAEAAKFIGLKGLPKFNIAWNALGGVFDKPTLFNYGGSLQGIGEAGAEAVIPLENNLGWLDKLATMLNEKQGNRPMVLMVDKKVLATSSVEGINDITRLTGSLPLVLG